MKHFLLYTRDKKKEMERTWLLLLFTTLQWVIFVEPNRKCHYMYFNERKDFQEENNSSKNCTKIRTTCPPEFKALRLEFPPYNDPGKCFKGVNSS